LTLNGMPHDLDAKDVERYAERLRATDSGAVVAQRSGFSTRYFLGFWLRARAVA